jgi:hypothetical protein
MLEKALNLPMKIIFSRKGFDSSSGDFRISMAMKQSLLKFLIAE